MEDETTPIVEQKESVKLIKTSKSYNWEIRLLEINLDRLTELNTEMVKRFGSQE